MFQGLTQPKPNLTGDRNDNVNNQGERCKAQLTTELIRNFKNADHSFKRRISKMLAKQVDDG
jgi:hypothetical protein